MLSTSGPMKNTLIVILSACSTHQCLAFAASASRACLVLPPHDVLVHASSPRWSFRNAPGGRHRSHQWRQSSLLRATNDEGSGVVDSGDEPGSGNDGAGSGMGLDGEWQVKSGQGRKARAGDGVGSVPGQLPEKTRDGQDWAEWAREWREDPQGKADRLVDQWEAEAKANGGSQGLGKSKKRSSKKKKKGSAGPSRGVVGSGFGGAARPTKSVPKGLVVAETGAGTGDVVDWSTGQQLTEADRKDNMAADWQQDAKHLESLDPSDREKLAEKIRIALGKKQQKTKKKAPSASGDGRGFSSSDSAPASGKPVKTVGDGDGRGVLASAAAAAGAVAAGDVAGVSVFPSVPVPAPAAAIAAVAAGQSTGGPLPLDVAPVEGEVKGGEDVVLGGGASAEDGIETEASNVAPTRAPAAPVGGGETPGDGKTVSPGDETSPRSGEAPLQRVTSFGKGVAVVEASSSSSSSSVDPSARLSVDGGKLSSVRNFGRGVAMPTEEVVEGDGGAEKASAFAEDSAGLEAGVDDGRLGGFGKGVAFPLESDASG